VSGSHSGKKSKHTAGYKPGRGQAPVAGGGGPKPTKNAIAQRGSGGGILKALTQKLWR
jgi:hypothetical protein